MSFSISKVCKSPLSNAWRQHLYNTGNTPKSLPFRAWLKQRKPAKTAHLGKHQKALLTFCAKHKGPHSFTFNRADLSHAALTSLARRGLLVRLSVGSTVMAQLPG